MNPPDCCLSLIVPKALEETVVDLLLEREALVPGFTTLVADGHGPNAQFRTARERVRGRAHCVLVLAMLETSCARQLLAELKAELEGTDIVWWLSPITAYGDFT